MKSSRIPKPSVDPFKNAYLLGIAALLRVEPHRVRCDVTIGKGGGLVLNVTVDDRDLTGGEERLVLEFLHEQFHGVLPRVEGGDG